MAGTDNYFRRPGLIVTLMVPLGVGLVTFSHLCPECLPRDYMYLLGPVGNLTLLLVDKYPLILSRIFYGMWAIHAGEVMYAYYLCRKKNLAKTFQWCAQTSIYGITSLKFLIAYDPNKKKKLR